MSYVLLPIAALVTIGAYALSLDPPAMSLLLREGGPIELGSVVLYLVCIALLLPAFAVRGTVTRWYVVVLLVFLAFRELDGDKKLFTLGLLKSRQYTGDAPLSEKLIGIVLLVVLALSLGLLAWRHGRAWLEAVLRLRPWAWAVGAGLAFMATSKLVDGAQRKLAPFGIELTPQAERWAFAYEEVAELGIGLMFAAALVNIALDRRRAPAEPSSTRRGWPGWRSSADRT